MPSFLNEKMQKCTPITPEISKADCLLHQRKWRKHGNVLKADTGIPEGHRISIGGTVVIVGPQGGSLTIDYETFKLRNFEYFLILIDQVEVLRVGPGEDLEEGFSVQRTDTKAFALTKGEHFIQFSVESQISGRPVFSYW